MVMRDRVTGLASVKTLLIISAVGMISAMILASVSNSHAEEMSKTVVRDSQTILLQGKDLPAKDFIHLYDTTPYMISVGHIAVKLECDENSKTPLNVLIGQAPKFKAAELELVKELSNPGKLCIYHVDVESNPDMVNGTITDIALQNPTNQAIKFGPTTTVVIGVDEIMPGAEAESAQMSSNMSMTQ
jgi:hypothetical protein